MSSYDVRVYKIEERKSKRAGKPTFTYRVRWQVAGERFGDSFKTNALAESFRAKLITAQREGVAFDERCGLPEPMARALNTRSWYEHVVAFVDLKWPRASANHRKGIAETLAGATMLLLSSTRGMPPEATLRKALRTYVCNKNRRDAGPPPPDLAPAVAWVAENTVNLTDLAGAPLVRKVLDGLALTLDGRAAAASTVHRKRAVFSGALRYGVELGHFTGHPMDNVKWSAPTAEDEEIDRRAVANQQQARRLLVGVRQTTPELEAFFGTLYFAGLRPEEALHLTNDEYERPTRKGEWGWLHLTGATVEIGNSWGDTDDTTEDRGLKHRSRKAVRDVPASPPLCALLDRHIKKWPPGTNGRLFVTRRGPGGMYVPTAGRPVTRNAISTAWRKARKATLTPAEYRSPLATVPYQLRHACLSLWLSMGISPALVARWAGHGIKVLLAVYASWIFGEERAAMDRIAERYEELPEVDESTE
ncbi:tyrosine-type recombinase/integrase [Actinoplanes sp. NPDC049265]|uniref:tyrosine-type recombinase/integrase n=1 Tax=Actinoplanes sp. NPDC049265 TaxID=3363902 RepID=UPI0037210BD8